MKRPFFVLLLAIVSLGFSSGLAHADTSLPAVATAHASSNWAGYVADTGYYTSVGGTWVVPIPGNAPVTALSGDATWVGIGGLSSAKDLIQAGTQAVVTNGTITYQAWYEILPDNETITPLVISGGDTVSTSLHETSTNSWHLTITDQTKNTSYETDISYQSTHATAEWIEERPIAISGTSDGYLPLDRFGSVDFTSAYTVANGNQLTLTSSDAQPLMMINAARNPLATPSVIGDDDSSFTIRQANSTNQMIENVPTTQNYTYTIPTATSTATSTQTRYVIPVARYRRFPYYQRFAPGGFNVEVFTRSY